jgi:hypothetical protein
MNIHVVWSQGWAKAPPKAVRNAEVWEQVGSVHRWCAESAIEAGLVAADLLALAKAPAMKTDLILAAAMLRWGGMAIGADMLPVDISAICNALKNAEAHNLGMVIYQSFRDEPFSGASYFPQGNKWLQLVCDKQHQNVRLNGDSRSVSAVTGPFMWRRLMRRHPGVWFSSVRCVPAWIAFTCEPKTRNTYREAWINPGLTGDWEGKHSERWQ